jgi:predicted RNase H-like HicB family nuclease
MKPNGQEQIFTAVVEYDPENKMYIASVPALPPVHTQAESLDELQTRLREAIELCLEDSQTEEVEPTLFIGLQQIEIAS